MGAPGGSGAELGVELTLQMNKSSLVSYLAQYGVDRNAYAFDVNSVRMEAFVLQKEDNQWHVFYFERGHRSQEHMFGQEKDAVLYLATRILGSPTCLVNQEDRIDVAEVIRILQDLECNEDLYAIHAPFKSDYICVLDYINDQYEVFASVGQERKEWRSFADENAACRYFLRLLSAIIASKERTSSRAW